MAIDVSVLAVGVRVLDTVGDADDVELAAGRLRAVLLDADDWEVSAGEPAPAPPGARSAAASVLGGLLIGLSQFPDALQILVDQVCAWLEREPSHRSVE